MARPIELEKSQAQRGSMPFELLRAMRPKEWVKNLFVVLAIAFSQDLLWLQFESIAIVVMAFALFCMVASAIYLINDLVDIEKDRTHPKKRYRPLAAGRLSPTVAIVAAVALLVVALPLGFALDYASRTRNLNFGIALLAYLLVQGFAYSFYLKHIVILDVFTIAAGFVLRTVAGALVLDIAITHWLLLCMGLLALLLGLAKRRAELVLLESGAGEHRRILDEYSLPLLDQMISIVTAATIIAYALFTATAETLPHTPFPVMMITVPFVIYTLFRYLYLMYQRGAGGNTADILLKDRPFALSIVLWGLTSLAILATA